jgi:poly(A) polymerase
MMEEDGVLGRILPEARRFERLVALLPLEPAADALRRLGALADLDGAGARALAERLRLANTDRDRLVAMAAPPWPVDLEADERAQRRALHHLGAPLYRDLVLLAAAQGGAADRVPARLALADGWQPQRFPLKGRDVTRLGVPPGPEVGRLLAEVTAWWEAADFRPNREACLAELAARLARR